MKRSPMWLAVLLAVACGSKTPAAGTVHDVSEETDLKDCLFVGKVEGTSSDAGNDAAANHAKHDARAKAAAMGATHVKWIIPCCTSVEAEAYRCDTPID